MSTQINASTQILDESLTTEKIANNAVTADKISDSLTVDSDRAVNTNHIRNSAIVERTIADDAITAVKLNGNVAGDAIEKDIDGSLKVKVDNTTIEITSDTLSVKSGDLQSQFLNSIVTVDGDIVTDIDGNIVFVPI